MNFDIRRYSISQLMVVVLLAVSVTFSWLDPIDTAANEQIDSGLKRAVVTFASARTLNALISVIQGTEVSAHPLGFGLTLTVGQILDPVNDLIESFSNLMLVASIAFGVQKVLVAIGSGWMVSLAFSALALAWCALLLLRKNTPAWIVRCTTVLIIVRFAIPLSLVGSGIVFDNFLKAKYETSHAEIQAVNSDLAIAKIALGEESSTAVQNSVEEQKKKPGFFGSMFGKKNDDEPAADNGSLGQAAPQAATPTEKQSIWNKINPKKQIESIKQVAERAVERIIDLMVVFVLQTIIIPLLLVWFLISAIRGSYTTPSGLPILKT